jgi:hypothetical protein
VRSAEQLIESILNSSRIPAGIRRREIQRELRCHIEDFVIAARKAGHDQEAVDKQVQAHFGDPDQIAEAFAWVYRHERRRLRALAFMLSTALLACGVSVTALATQAALAFSLGTPIMGVLASKHTVMEALDILASVATYLGVISLEGVFDNHRFQKAAFLLAVTLTLLMMSCAAVGLHVTFPIYGLVTGIFFRALQLFVARKLVRIGIVTACFAMAGVVAALRWSADSPAAVAATCASWLTLGACYQLMTHLAARVDAVLLARLQRIQVRS